MSPHALIWWAIAIALVAVLALTGAQVARALREVRRLEARVDGFADLPVVKALGRAQRDAARMDGALAQIEPLAARANAALAVIKRGPVPPELISAVRRVNGDIAAIRAVRR